MHRGLYRPLTVPVPMTANSDGILKLLLMRASYSHKLNVQPVWSFAERKKPEGDRLPAGTSNTLKRPAQRKLNQPWVAIRLDDLAERAICRPSGFNVGHRRIREVRVVP